MKDYMVYSLRVATALVDKGFEVINTSININNPKLKVFYFENTKELREAVAELTKA